MAFELVDEILRGLGLERQTEEQQQSMRGLVSSAAGTFQLGISGSRLALQNHSVLTTLGFFIILLRAASRLLAALGRFDAPELAGAIVLSFLSMIYARAPEMTRHTVVVQTISAVCTVSRP